MLVSSVLHRTAIPPNLSFVKDHLEFPFLASVLFCSLSKRYEFAGF
jgi:hypothetical protein